MSTRLLFLLFLLISLQAQAQMYKWVEPDGKKNYSDKPPLVSASHIETRSMPISTTTAALPYELARAVNNMPVILYSADKVTSSAEARNFLMKNGIPFSEKTISSDEDIDKLVQISGSAQVPVLYIGRSKLTGFSAGEWRTTLTRAGYPESNMLPSGYHFSVPQQLVPTTVGLGQVSTKSSVKPSESETPTRNPTGFHF